MKHPRLKQPIASGMTVLELIVVICVIGVLVGLFLPFTRSSREAARRMSCSNNFKQVGLALHAYHSAHEQLPVQLGGTFHPSTNSGGSSAPENNRYRLSFLVGLMPFMEQQALWDQIVGGEDAVPMGPAPWTRDFKPWQTDVPTLRCPSDPGVGLPAHGRTNVAACLGDATDSMHTGPIRWDGGGRQWVSDRETEIAASGRGMFVPRRVIRFRQVLDGLSNTIMAGEIASDLDDGDKRTAASLANPWAMIHDHPDGCLDQVDTARPSYWVTSPDQRPASLGESDQKRGFRWADGAALYSGFTTILPPNRESCVAGGEAGVGMLSVSSRHQGGAHVLMGDGAVVFVTDSIECGNQQIGTVIHEGTGPRAPGSPSPYGLWGALGTRAQNDSVEESLNR